MSRTMQFPPVVHMVADLDNLDVSAPRRGRRAVVGQLMSMMRRLQRRMATSAVLSLVLLVLIACSDSSDPVNPTEAVATVAVSPAAPALTVGQTAQLTATLKDAAGNVLTGRTVEWSSSSTATATVSTAGVVTAVAEGAATISARSEGKTGQVEVTVTRAPVARVNVTPLTVILEVRATRTITAIAFDANDNVLAGRTVQWSTDAPGVATVSAAGVVTAVAHGYAGIIATIEGKTASSVITVVEPEPAEQYDVVYERRQFNQLGDIRRFSPVDGTSSTLSIPRSPGKFIRDVAPSPDGLRLAFTLAWYPEGSTTLDGDIYVVNLDGTGLTRLTNAEEMDDQPAWSPDGMRIAFRSQRSGNSDIWVMAANGTGQVNLMTDLLPATSSDHNPTWSPDGSRIAYSSDIDNFAYPKLWTMSRDGTDKRRVLPLSGMTDIDGTPSWSPDGTRIAFRRISGMGLSADIAIATIATGQVARITLEGPQGFPSWSPDGSRIAFTSSHQGLIGHIFTMKPDGTEIVKHTSGTDENTYPRWLRVQ